MLMYCFHIAFSVGLIALASGAAILIWAKAHENIGTDLAKLIGYLVVVFSVLSIACTSYSAFKNWQQGDFGKSCSMMSGQMMGGKNMPVMSGQMMDGKNMPMMSGQMMKNQDGQDQMMQNQMNSAPMPQDAPVTTQNPNPSTTTQ